MKPSQLTKRIEELSVKLKPTPSEGVKIDFHSFTEAEQFVLLKSFELDDKYQGKWTHEAVMENKDIIVKANHILISRVTELFTFTMPRAMMLDEVDQFFFRFHFNTFMENWIDCMKKVSKWSKKDREDFQRDITPKTKTVKKQKNEVRQIGKENNN
ncbi:MAG: hypothetical protein ABSD92_07330 [Candidatus Bathyarchaeia archaeon]|jgi:hypothetical protein